MIGKNILGALFAVLILCLAMPDIAVADGSKSKGKRTKIELKAKLNPPSADFRSRDGDDDDDDGDDDDGAHDNVGGEAKYKSSLINGVVQSERFEAKIELPFPSPGLAIDDIGTALIADFQLLLTTPTVPGGTAAIPYATCLLDLAEIKMKFFQEELIASEAEYKLDVRAELKNGVLTPKIVRGSCTSTSLTGVPAAKAGDIVTVVLATAPTTPLLVGTLKTHHDDD
jgi:hypothetical protein